MTNLESVRNIEEAEIGVDLLQLIASSTVRPFTPYQEHKAIERTSFFSSLSSVQASTPSPPSLSYRCKSSTSSRASRSTSNPPTSHLYPSWAPSLPAIAGDGESSNLSSRHDILPPHEEVVSAASPEQKAQAPVDKTQKELLSSYKKKKKRPNGARRPDLSNLPIQTRVFKSTRERNPASLRPDFDFVDRRKPDFGFVDRRRQSVTFTTKSGCINPRHFTHGTDTPRRCHD